MANLFIGTWAARSYLIAVLGTALTALASGSAYALALLIALTSPVSIIFAPVFLLGDGWQAAPMMVLSVLAGYLLNVVLINWLVAAGSRVGRPSRPPQPVRHGGSDPRRVPAGRPYPVAGWQHHGRVPAGVR